MLGLIDTHSHAWVDDWSGSDEALLEAKHAGVLSMVLTAGGPDNWDACRGYAHRWGLPYMLGVHPLWAEKTTEANLDAFEGMLPGLLADPLFIGIGEVGLDGVVPMDQAWAETVFLRMLKLARRHALPMSVHLRKSASRLQWAMRRAGLPEVPGVIHAFNGSDVERDRFLAMGWKLGFGGAATYDGSLRIRRHLAELPADRWVLETDAPDMPSTTRRDRGEESRPSDMAEVLGHAAALRGISPEEAVRVSMENALAAFPRLAGAIGAGAGSAWAKLGL